jgi:wyosine [tRNA(Phe)-imidazoG37] synthetase (radical SAM superfamily)
MKFSTFCVVAGNQVCTARCKWCVSSMTPAQGVGFGKAASIDPGVFDMACRLAMQSHLDTVRITGKGEPTLFPDQITEYLQLLRPYMADKQGFVFAELQTHGLHLTDGRVKEETMKGWRDLGMTHVCISLVSSDPEQNAKHYFPHKGHYYDVAALIHKLHSYRFNVRLTCIMQKGDVDCDEKLDSFLTWTRDVGADQVTVLPVNRPSDSRDAEAYKAAVESQLTGPQLAGIVRYCETQGKLVRTLPWGGRIFDIKGQNLCLNYCLTHSPNVDDSRQLIFLPPGTIGYDWEYAGAVLFKLPEPRPVQVPTEAVIQLGVPEKSAQ